MPSAAGLGSRSRRRGAHLRDASVTYNAPMVRVARGVVRAAPRRRRGGRPRPSEKAACATIDQPAVDIVWRRIGSSQNAELPRILLHWTSATISDFWRDRIAAALRAMSASILRAGTMVAGLYTITRTRRGVVARASFSRRCEPPTRRRTSQTGAIRGAFDTNIASSSAPRRVAAPLCCDLIGRVTIRIIRLVCTCPSVYSKAVAHELLGLACCEQWLSGSLLGAAHRRSIGGRSAWHRADRDPIDTVATAASRNCAYFGNSLTAFDFMPRPTPGRQYALTAHPHRHVRAGPATSRRQRFPRG